MFSGSEGDCLSEHSTAIFAVIDMQFRGAPRLIRVPGSVSHRQHFDRPHHWNTRVWQSGGD